MRASPTPASIVDAIWRALRDGVGAVHPNRVAVFADRFGAADLASRWAVLDLVEDIGLYDIVHAEDFDALLEVFEVATITGYARPRSRARDAIGSEYLALADVAELLIMLERCGLPVDPAPLVAALRPRLKSKALLTSAEVRVWWFEQERHRSEAMLLSIDEKGVAGGGEIRTAAGYRAEAWLNPEGKAVRLWVRSPRYRHRRAS